MSPEFPQSRRVLVWATLIFSAVTFLVSWWHWWTFQYGTFDLAFYVQALWLALRGEWMVSLLNVPLMGNHAEPIVFLLTPLFAICPHPMLFVAAQTLAFASMPFTAYRIGRRLELDPKAALLMALTTILTPATFSIAIYEFHPEALAAPFILLLIEARLAGRIGSYWLWFIAVLSTKENMAPLLVLFCGVFAFFDRKTTARHQAVWNIGPTALAFAWLLIYGKIISPSLNAGNVDYLQLYGHLGKSPGDIIRNFFVEPQRALGALHVALTQGNMVWALLLPYLFLPLFRPRWLLIASPLLAQHLLSWRYSEWSLGAHYPAPFIPLFWIAAAEALRRLRMQTGIAAAVLAACVVAHLRFGEACNTAREIPALGAILEDRERKAQMINAIPDGASVTASLAFLPHLAKREKLVSLHHILKGLKTLSSTAYTPPPPADAVVIDYSDSMTFNTGAGYYHPRMRVEGERFVPSSDQLLHDYLAPVKWRTSAQNAVTLLRRGEPLASSAPQGKSVKLDDQTTLAGLEIVKKVPGALQLRLAWQFSGERKRFPWLILVLSDGKHLHPILKGACAVEAGDGLYFEDWSVDLPSSLPAGYYVSFAQFYDGNEAIWKKQLPPDNATHSLTIIDLGEWNIQPGNYVPSPAPSPAPAPAPAPAAAAVN